MTLTTDNPVDLKLGYCYHFTMTGLFKTIWNRLNAAQLAISSFAAVVFFGAFLLTLPVSATKESIRFIDALFTATSATCVTGLSVVDISTTFSLFGQVVILILIQVGGFGIIAISTLILFVVGKRVSMVTEDSIGSSFLNLQRYSLKDLVWRALFFTLLIELAGLLLLFPRWYLDFPLKKSIWFALFHSVSAFCNAGFSLFPDNLMIYVSDPLVNFTIMILIVSGGIGFFVMIDIWDRIRAKRGSFGNKLSFHSRIVLIMTFILIIGGTLFLFMMEKSSNLSGIGFGQGIMRSMFQSVTARTAGFNTMDIKSLSNSSLFLLIFLMFIGGAPGSCAGGVKVSTFGVLVLVVLSRIKNTSNPAIFSRSISRKNIESALILVLLSVVFIAFCTMILLITELGGTPHMESRGLFLELLFECVSAFGTVGLSTGVTPSLSDPGRLLITFIMFTGRLGPMTLVFALERRKTVNYKFPEEDLIIG
jgi:trk system potassium uptake protein